VSAIGIAVLSYHLYDIDRLLNRVVVYGLLTAILAIGYMASVLVLDQFFGQDRSSLGRRGRHPGHGGRVPTAAPPRARRGRPPLQPASLRRGPDRGGVHYPSPRQIDLDTLHEELLAVVDQTMEPTTCRCGCNHQQILH
jgi:hypothetical protein